MIGDAYLPYRTLDDYISGAVIAFTDSTGLKTLEAELQATTRFAERIVEILREPDGGAWQPPALRQRLGEALRHPAAPFEDCRVSAGFPGAGRRDLQLYGRCITSQGSKRTARAYARCLITGRWSSRAQ